MFNKAVNTVITVIQTQLKRKCKEHNYIQKEFTL